MSVASRKSLRSRMGLGPGESRRVLARPRGLARAVVPPLVVLAGVIGFWQIYVDQRGGALVPRPATFAQAVPKVFTSGAAWSALATSDLSLVMGYAIAVAIGVPSGLVMARNRFVDRLASPYLEMSIVVPMAVMMPVVLMALGLTRRAQVVVILIFALPFIVPATRTGARVIPTDWLDMARVFGAKEVTIWRRVLVPGAISSIVAGLRLGFAQALTGLVTVELTLIALGIGKQLIFYQSHFETAELFAFVLLLMVQSVVVMSALTIAERHIARRTRASA